MVGTNTLFYWYIKSLVRKIFHQVKYIKLMEVIGAIHNSGSVSRAPFNQPSIVSIYSAFGQHCTVSIQCHLPVFTVNMSFSIQSHQITALVFINQRIVRRVLKKMTIIVDQLSILVYLFFNINKQ
ncbi:unnamed protein product [Nezara viridula]|uniref:Uncharacterized protein n=1 Tax=Nezara viridula TaxID=85310 RepID=A0A9P0MWV2_NEZVI|nr:unnamed protein product [Nezara viridula]